MVISESKPCAYHDKERATHGNQAAGVNRNGQKQRRRTATTWDASAVSLHGFLVVSF